MVAKVLEIELHQAADYARVDYAITKGEHEIAALKELGLRPNELRRETSVVRDRTVLAVREVRNNMAKRAIFSPAGKPEKGVGQRFERADGRAILSIYSGPNEAGDNPATYLRHNLRVSRSALDYARITRSFFAISSEREGVILYSRCNFSGSARGAIHCFDLKYPQEEKRSWDAVVTRISLSLRPLES